MCMGIDDACRPVGFIRASRCQNRLDQSGAKQRSASDVLFWASQHHGMSASRHRYGAAEMHLLKARWTASPVTVFSMSSWSRS
jgi:hypothetical protein